MSHYKIISKNNLIEASSPNHAMMKLTVDTVAKKVKNLSKEDQKKIRNELYGYMMKSFKAVKTEDENQIKIQFPGE